ADGPSREIKTGAERGNGGAKATGASLDNVASNIHAGQQGKHVLGHNNFIPGRSYFDEGVDPQKLLNGAHAGEFPVVGYGSRGQPIVDFGQNIGVDGSSGLATRYGTIHSGKNGAHIVPTNPATVGAEP
ncbi:MAG: polymorphic toxin type 50 domain-containing protein, partial [Gammaproteobacteria bacterium]